MNTRNVNDPTDYPKPLDYWYGAHHIGPDHVCTGCGRERDLLSVYNLLRCSFQGGMNIYQDGIVNTILKEPDMDNTTAREQADTKPVAAPRTAIGLLNQARDIQEQRARDYDQPGGERSMLATVVAFNTITRRDLSESEGFLLLQILKDVRDRSTGKPHFDSLLDGVSYSSLKAEARLREDGVTLKVMNTEEGDKGTRLDAMVKDLRENPMSLEAGRTSCIESLEHSLELKNTVIETLSRLVDAKDEKIRQISARLATTDSAARANVLEMVKRVKLKLGREAVKSAIVKATGSNLRVYDIEPVYFMNVISECDKLLHPADYTEEGVLVVPTYDGPLES